MKRLRFLTLLLALTGVAQTSTTNFLLRLERRTDALEMVVDGTAASGAFFIYQASNPQSLLDTASVAVQTNTPLVSGLRFALPAPGVLSPQTFFSAAHWPGRAAEEFGDPEDYPDIPPPDMVLFTSGAPAPLASGQTFTVDFFITDPAGQMLDLSSPVAIGVVRQSDGTAHPDATVSPPTGELTNGHLRIALTVQSVSPLDGYLLGLGPSSRQRPFFPVSTGLDQPLVGSFNTTPATMEQRRTDNADAGPSWSYPLEGSGQPVSGTFGEWRGKNNSSVHRGLDLAAVASSTVKASRGGVVSRRGNLPGMGDYLVIDHGTGEFSRYLHLDPALITVSPGQAVAHGATLATGLYAVGNWPQHLHFEIRQGPNHSQWNVGLPGAGQDPLQRPGIFPVPPSVSLPEMREFGLTRQHPSQFAFVKAAPTADAPGPVYLFAKFVHPTGGHLLGLRSTAFQPEGAVSPVEIRPRDDTAISELLPPGTNAQKGFARYGPSQAASPDPNNYFRYWWQWKTSDYPNDRKGPRNVTLSGVDYSGTSSDYTFSFGPEILSIVPDYEVANKYWVTNVAHLGAYGSYGAPYLTQPDVLKLEMLEPDGTLLEGVMWHSPLASSSADPRSALTPLLTNHLQTNGFAFTLPDNGYASLLLLRLSSLLAQDIAHETPLEQQASISGGFLHSLFIKADTSLWGMGDNEYGQLGLGTFDTNSPQGRAGTTQIATGVRAVACGQYHSLFIKVDATLWGMGNNYPGQLGVGTFDTNWPYGRATPTQIATGVRALACGGAHSLFIKGDTSLWGMGNNEYGQLGLGTFDTNSPPGRATPMQIATGVRAVAAGYLHSLFLKADGTLWGMGGNQAGQLGLGAFDTNLPRGRATPTQIATGVRAVACGQYHSFFLKADGTLWGMGYNYSGQLGLGTFDTNSPYGRATPTQIATGVRAVAGGLAHSLFLNADGSLWGIGNNGAGQLGLGTFDTNSPYGQATPIQIATGTR